MRLSTGQRKVEMLKDYVGLRAGHTETIDAGVADVLVHRGFAKYVEAEEAPPPKPAVPERAVLKAQEFRDVPPVKENPKPVVKRAKEE